MAQDINYFKRFLEKSYDSTFNTKRSGKNNTLTSVNFCIVPVLNTFLEPKIKEFELVMPSGCYSEILDTGSGNVISKCLSGYGQLKDQQINNIFNCISPTTTTTTTSRI